MKKKSRKKKVLVGICGGIASYKTCELVRLLIKGGYSVKVMMTESGTKFVTPLVFQELSHEPVYTEMFNPLEKIPVMEKSSLTGFTLIREETLKHISLACWADLCVIVPLSANTLSKIANGICDNLLTTVICALPLKTQIILAPAMNKAMWKNPLIQGNVEKLAKIKKYLIIPPEKGELACGIYGEGRMPEVKEVLKKIKSAL